MTQFGEMLPDGSIKFTRSIDQADILKCPHVILVPEHYREDGSCRCDDPEHVVMIEWGYIWNGNQWS